MLAVDPWHVTFDDNDDNDDDNDDNDDNDDDTVNCRKINIDRCQ